MRTHYVSLFIAFSLLAAGCAGTMTSNARPAARALATSTTAIHSGDQLYIVIEGIEGPGLLFRLERSVDKNGDIVLPYIDKVRLGGVAIENAAHAIHLACRKEMIDGEGLIWVWRLQSAAPANDPNAPLHAGDLLKIVMSGLEHPGDDEFLADIGADGMLRIQGLGAIPAAHFSEREVAKAIISAIHQKGLENVMAIVWKLPRVEQ